MMPNVNGIDLCRRIREIESDTEKYTYLIMVTAKTESSDLVEALEVGADDFISKPIDEQVLASRIRAGERILNANLSLAEKKEELVFHRNQMIVHNVGLRGQIEALKNNMNDIAPAKDNLETSYVSPLENSEIHLVECADNVENRAISLFVKDITHGVPGLVLSRQPPNKMKDKYDLKKTEVIWLTKGLSDNEIKNNLPLYFLVLDFDDSDSESSYNINLKAILDIVTDFISSNENPVVLLDGIEYLFSRFPTFSTMRMLYDLCEVVKGSNSKLIVSYYPGTLEPRILTLLTREMHWIPSEG